MGTFFYALAWLLFAALHSLLARSVIQKKAEIYLGRSYRLIYNLLALLTIALVLLAGRHWLNGTRFSVFDSNIVFMSAFGIQILGYIVLLVALLKYDVGRFAGITQLFTGERVSASTSEPLQKQGLNRWVRHPLYTGVLLVLWGGAVSLFDVWTAIWGTVYLLIGTMFEERKLLRIYGDDYHQYKKEVPRYFPVKFVLLKNN